MIVRYMTNSMPILTVGLCTKIESNVIIREDKDDIVSPINFNINDYDCCYTELALVDMANQEDAIKNDISSFLFKKSLPTDTIEIKLFKCENGIDEEKAILNDNTYGIYYAQSYFGDDYRVGYLLDWRLVMSSFGAGIYFVRTNREIINRESVLETHKFQLMPYNEFLADGTVRIETYSRGYIEGGINYLGTGVNWRQMIRVRGKFWNKQNTLEIDNYQDTSRKLNQIQDKILVDYDLDVEAIPREIAEPLLKDKILANDIFIVDYNLFNYEKHVVKSVYPKEITNQKYFNRTANGVFSFKFTDKTQNLIKRNFI